MHNATSENGGHNRKSFKLTGTELKKKRGLSQQNGDRWHLWIII